MHNSLVQLSVLLFCKMCIMEIKNNVEKSEAGTKTWKVQVRNAFSRVKFNSLAELLLTCDVFHSSWKHTHPQQHGDPFVVEESQDGCSKSLHMSNKWYGPANSMKWFKNTRRQQSFIIFKRLKASFALNFNAMKFKTVITPVFPFNAPRWKSNPGFLPLLNKAVSCDWLRTKH